MNAITNVYDKAMKKSIRQLFSMFIIMFMSGWFLPISSINAEIFVGEEDCYTQYILGTPDHWMYRCGPCDKLLNHYPPIGSPVNKCTPSPE